MILYPNRERWFLNIRSRNNRIIISDSLFFNFNGCNYFYFNVRIIEYKRNLLERIKRNSKDWDLDESMESGMTPKFDCVKSFMDTDIFRKFSTKYGLDSEIVASFLLLMLISPRRSGLNIILP